MPRKGTWIPVNEHNAKTFAEFLNKLEDAMQVITDIDIELTNNRRVEGVIKLKGHHDYIFGKWVGVGKETEKKKDEASEL